MRSERQEGLPSHPPKRTNGAVRRIDHSSNTATLNTTKRTAHSRQQTAGHTEFKRDQRRAKRTAQYKAERGKCARCVSSSQAVEENPKTGTSNYIKNAPSGFFRNPSHLYPPRLFRHPKPRENSPRGRFVDTAEWSNRLHWGGGALGSSTFH